jgi:hypothetical protein
MLRGAVLAVGVVMLLAGLGIAVAWPVGVGASLWLLVVGGLITVGTILERVIYKPLQRKAPGAGWVKTAERFIDPDTGQPVDVFYNPATGERQYVSPEKKTTR